MFELTVLPYIILACVLLIMVAVVGSCVVVSSRITRSEEIVETQLNTFMMRLELGEKEEAARHKKTEVAPWDRPTNFPTETTGKNVLPNA